MSTLRINSIRTWCKHSFIHPAITRSHIINFHTSKYSHSNAKIYLKIYIYLKKQNNIKGSATIQFKVEKDRSPDRLNSEAQASATLIRLLGKSTRRHMSLHSIHASSGSLFGNPTRLLLRSSLRINQVKSPRFPS